MEEQPFQVKTPEYVSLQFQLANLGSRATASIIDYAIIIIAQILVFLGLAFLAGFTSEFYFFSSGWIIAIVFIILFVFNFGYFIILDWSTSTTSTPPCSSTAGSSPTSPR